MERLTKSTAILMQSGKAMALFHWLTRLDSCVLMHGIQASLEGIGFEIDSSATSRQQLYAKERQRKGVSARALVTILISQVDTSPTSIKLR